MKTSLDTLLKAIDPVIEWFEGESMQNRAEPKNLINLLQNMKDLPKYKATPLYRWTWLKKNVVPFIREEPKQLAASYVSRLLQRN
jgi:hypothetical protein